MSFDTSYLFPIHEEEIEIKCHSCSFYFDSDKFSSLRPYFLPCSDLICEVCLDFAKKEDSYDCPKCKMNYTRSELHKVKFNTEFSSILRKNSCPNKKTNMDILSKKKEINSFHICDTHKKEIIKNLFCFYHKIKICSDCLLEHQYSKCIIKKFTISDTQFLINKLKTQFVNIFDLKKNFSDSLNIIESKLLNEETFNIFHDHSEILKCFNILNYKLSHKHIFNFLEDKTYLCSSLELKDYFNLTEKLKNKTIITNFKCLKFLTNNFKISSDFTFFEKTIKSFQNIIIHAYNKYKEDSNFYVKYHGDLYRIDNIDKEDTKLVLIENNFEFLKIKQKEEKEINLKINESQFIFFDVFIYDNLFQIVDSDFDSQHNFTKILYSNDKYFIFDFLNLFEINNNNYLKITFRFDEKEVVNNLYMKIVKYLSQNEYLVDYYVVDTNPMHFCKLEKKARLIIEGNFLKSFFIDKELEISNGKINIFYDSGLYSGKVESITYFKLKNC
jgi:hypothetical protein